MALRHQEHRKNLTSLRKRNYRNSIFRASFSLADRSCFELTFAPGIHVLCGGNGAGKTTILSALWNCIAPEKAQHSRSGTVQSWLQYVTVDGTSNGTNWRCSLQLENLESQGSCPISCEYINASAESEAISSFLRQDDNLQDLLDGVDPAPFESDEVEMASSLLRKSYSKIEVVEIENYLNEDNDLPLPYFRVISAGVEYDAMSMGRGELSALYLLWRLFKAESNSILFLDEPESHLALFSQNSMLRLLVRQAVSKGMQSIISSHHPEIFSILEEDAVALVSGPPAVGVRQSTSNQDKSSFLGVNPRTTVVLVCEDYVAREMCKRILSVLAPDIAGRVEVKYLTTGESGVKQFAANISEQNSDSVHVAGLLDGDMRVAVDRQSNLGALPGDGGPEKIMRDAINAWRNEGAEADYHDDLAMTSDQLLTTLESLDGMEDHEWIAALGVRLGSTKTAVRFGVAVMLKDEALRQQSVDLVAWIEGLEKA